LNQTEKPARRLTRELVIQIVLCIGAGFVYFRVRGMTEYRPHVADRNAELLIRAERALGIAWESVLQQQVIDSPTVIMVVVLPPNRRAPLSQPIQADMKSRLLNRVFRPDCCAARSGPMPL
jgi:hypothetical protein